MAPLPRLGFPAGFLWGTSTSAHQVEGGNENNDWWDWEGRPGAINDGTRSGEACGWWAGRAEEDLSTAAAEGQNAHRLSLEWSRLEPEPGCFDDLAFARYAQLLDEMGRLGLLAMVTLHHVTLPRWIARRGGWTSWDTAASFGRYAAECARRLAQRVPLWATMNEPAACAAAGYALTYWPPALGSNRTALRALAVMLEAHASAYRAVKQVAGGARVGIVLSAPRIEPARGRRARPRGGVGSRLGLPRRYPAFVEDRRAAAADRGAASARSGPAGLVRLPRRELLRPLRGPIRRAQPRAPLRQARAGAHHPDGRLRLGGDFAGRPDPAARPPLAARSPAVRDGEWDP